MRKATIALLVVVALWGATSWRTTNQPQPQWRVVQSVILTHQTDPIPQTTIFTPQQQGLYRLTGYMTAKAKETPPPGSALSFEFACTDSSPEGYCVSGIQLQSPSYLRTGQVTYVFSPHSGTPVTYAVTQPPPNVEYTLAFTIEQLE